MKQFDIDCYQVVESYDRDVNHVAFVANISLAQELVNKQKGYRTYHKYKKLITIFDSIEEMEANSREALIKSAVSKLTTAELNALTGKGS